MAAQIAALNPKLPPTHAGQLLRDFVDAFDSVQEQLRKGTTQAVVPLTKISLLGTEGVAILKKHLEDSTNARFTFSVNASANSVTLMPTGPMPPKPAVTARSLALPAGNASKTAGSKVPRPPNAFIIYRKEWHPRIVAQNPGLHNNAISVIIGEKWKAENDHVRAEYKEKAEEAKRQHAINNPGYQYQPRKPSEKKKRMTKNKLAKLAEKAQQNGNITGDVMQQPLPDDFDPISMLDEHLGSCAATQPLGLNAYDHFPAPAQQPPTLRETTRPDFLAFNPAADPFGELRTSLLAFNQANPQLNNTQEHGAVAFTAHPTIDGHCVDVNQIQQPLPGVGYNDVAIDTQENLMGQTGSAGNYYNPHATQPVTSAAAPVTQDFRNAEVVRQENLEVQFTDLFDMDAYDTNEVGPAGTQITYDINGHNEETGTNDNAVNQPAAEMAGPSDLTINTDYMPHWSQNFDLQFPGEDSGY